MLIGTSLEEYYNHLHLHKDILYLYANRLLIQVASGILVVFTAIFFYEKFNESFTTVAILFALAYGIYALVVPLFAQFINYFSLKKLIIVSILFLPLTLLSLTLWDINQALSLSLYMTLGLLYRMLYWTPYHIEFTKFTDRKVRGKQISFLVNISEVVLSLTPFIGGLIIAAYGFNVIFVLTAIFSLISIMPLFMISNVYERYTFSYFQTFRELFQRKNRSLLFGFMGDGIQSSARIVIWPIFVFVLLNQEYVKVGLLTSAAVLIIILLRFFIGFLADRWSRKRLLKFGSFLATTGWIIKVFVDSSFQIIAADTYHRMGQVVNRLSADIVSYDHAADNGHYIDEYTVMREVAINLGRALFLVVSIWVVAVFGISATFFIAAGATLLMTLLNKDTLIR